MCGAFVYRNSKCVRFGKEENIRGDTKEVCVGKRILRISRTQNKIDEGETFKYKKMPGCVHTRE